MGKEGTIFDERTRIGKNIKGIKGITFILIIGFVAVVIFFCIKWLIRLLEFVLYVIFCLRYYIFMILLSILLLFIIYKIICKLKDVNFNKFIFAKLTLLIAMIIVCNQPGYIVMDKVINNGFYTDSNILYVLYSFFNVSDIFNNFFENIGQFIFVVITIVIFTLCFLGITPNFIYVYDDGAKLFNKVTIKRPYLYIKIMHNIKRILFLILSILLLFKIVEFLICLGIGIGSEFLGHYKMDEEIIIYNPSFSAISSFAHIYTYFYIIARLLLFVKINCFDTNKLVKKYKCICNALFASNKIYVKENDESEPLQVSVKNSLNLDFKCAILDHITNNVINDKVQLFLSYDKKKIFVLPLFIILDEILNSKLYIFDKLKVNYYDEQLLLLPDECPNDSSKMEKRWMHEKKDGDIDKRYSASNFEYYDVNFTKLSLCTDNNIDICSLYLSNDVIVKKELAAC